MKTKPPKILAFIPARGGSKGVPRKNIRPLGGHPLIAYSIGLAKSCPEIYRTVVSTEDDEIAQVAIELGAEVIRRPQDLAQDSSPTEPSIQHAIREIESENKSSRPDFIVLLQPTSPFRTQEHLQEAFRFLQSGEHDAVMSLTEVEAHFHPAWQKTIQDGKVTSPFFNEEVDHPIVETERYYQRQLLPGKFYWKNGAIYVFSYDSIMNLGHRYGTSCAPLIMEKRTSINIDSEEDFNQAEKFLRENSEFQINEGAKS